MKKYKVALITNIPSPYRIPLFEKMAEHQSIDLYVYFNAVTEENREWNVELSDKFKYKILPCFGLNLSYWSKDKDFYNYHINPSIIQELIKNDYDVVIAGGYSSFAAQISFFQSKLRGTPYILWSGGTINDTSPLRTISLPLARFIVRHSNAFVAYGTRAKEYLITLGAFPEKIFIAYNTVDIDFYMQQSVKFKASKNKLKDRLGIKNEMIVLYVGRIVELKNVRTLIKAYSELKNELDVALLIVGDGMQKSKLRNMCIEESIDDVFFVGFKQKEEILVYYAISDLFVFPSTKDIWGLVLNEAMASGLPVITTDKVGASVDLIEEGVNGYVVESGDIEELHEAMRKILLKPEVRSRMGKASKEIIESRFTINDAVNGFIEAIAYVVNKRGCRNRERDEFQG